MLLMRFMVASRSHVTSVETRSFVIRIQWSKKWMNAFVWFEVTFRPVNSVILFDAFRRQMFKYPMGDFIPSIIREHIVRVRTNIIHTGKAVFHDLWNTIRYDPWLILANFSWSYCCGSAHSAEYRETRQRWKLKKERCKLCSGVTHPRLTFFSWSLACNTYGSLLDLTLFWFLWCSKAIPAMKVLTPMPEKVKNRDTNCWLIFDFQFNQSVVFVIKS